MTDYSKLDFATDILDILPNPVLVKNDNLEYVFINTAFEQLFNVSRLRVLDTGEIDEAVESVIDRNGSTRETITRKSRLDTDENTYLVGVMHDITEVTKANAALKESELKRPQIHSQAVTIEEL